MCCITRILDKCLYQIIFLKGAMVVSKYFWKSWDSGLSGADIPSSSHLTPVIGQGIAGFAFYEAD